MYVMKQYKECSLIVRTKKFGNFEIKTAFKGLNEKHRERISSRPVVTLLKKRG
jgi:hypothetical protein